MSNWNRHHLTEEVASDINCLPHTMQWVTHIGGGALCLLPTTLSKKDLHNFKNWWLSTKIVELKNWEAKRFKASSCFQKKDHDFLSWYYHKYNFWSWLGEWLFPVLGSNHWCQTGTFICCTLKVTWIFGIYMKSNHFCLIYNVKNMA